MAASKVPKFGAWEEGENYTVYFDKARKQKTNGQILTPNDPEYYYEMFQQNGGSAQAPQADSKGQKTKAPEFGAWGNEDNEDNVGYTAYFDNPRKSKNGGPTASENEPKMNRDINPRKDPPAQARPQPPKPEQQVRSKVPEFGAWEDGGEVGYTQSFENVKRNNKNGRTVNPEPSDAPKLNRDVSEPPSKEGRSKVPRFGDWNGGEDGQYTTVFDNARKNKNAGPVLDQVEPQFNRDVSDRARPPTAAGHLRNASKGSTASETSRNGRQHPGVQSPYHQKGAKLQQRPPAGRGNQNTEKAAAVPAWGVWNTDPQQADGFTGAFRRAKEERNTPLNPNIPARYHQQSPKQKPKRKEGCCFGLF